MLHTVHERQTELLVSGPFDEDRSAHVKKSNGGAGRFYRAVLAIQACRFMPGIDSLRSNVATARELLYSEQKSTFVSPTVSAFPEDAAGSKFPCPSSSSYVRIQSARLSRHSSELISLETSHIYASRVWCAVCGHHRRISRR
jgi:hypothetical protein